MSSGAKVEQRSQSIPRSKDSLKCGPHVGLQARNKAAMTQDGRLRGLGLQIPPLSPRGALPGFPG